MLWVPLSHLGAHLESMCVCGCVSLNLFCNTLQSLCVLFSCLPLFEEETKREALRLRELELRCASSSSGGTDFHVNKCIRLVPPFCEKDVDTYSILSYLRELLRH